MLLKNIAGQVGADTARMGCTSFGVRSGEVKWITTSFPEPAAKRYWVFAQALPHLEIAEAYHPIGSPIRLPYA